MNENLPIENLVYCPALEKDSTASAVANEFNFEKIPSKKLPATTKTTLKELRQSYNLSEIFKFRTKIVWFNAIGFLLIHLVGFYGFYLVVQQLLAGQYYTCTWMFLLAFLGGEGVTIGAHRLWSHKSFKATKSLQIFLIILQTLAGQNCCYIWVRDHRQHHKYSDTDADPHNASRGFFFSHIGWLMMKKHPDVISKGKRIDMSDLEANPIIMFQKKYFKSLYFVISFLLPVLTPMFVWNESFWSSLIINFFARYVLLLNITWSVNSVAHMFGTKPYNKAIFAVESYFVSFFAFGEGWHNYHHSFPWDYRAAEFGTKLNTTTRIIEFFQKMGLAYDLRVASYRLIYSKIRNSGDGSHYSCDFKTCNLSEETELKIRTKGVFKNLKEIEIVEDDEKEE